MKSAQLLIKWATTFIFFYTEDVGKEVGVGGLEVWSKTRKPRDCGSIPAADDLRQILLPLPLRGAGLPATNQPRSVKTNFP